MGSPFFSVVVASRNRPELLRLAVQSVMGQTFQDFELILVNDGSDQQYVPDIDAVVAEYEGRVCQINLVHYPRGHGQSYSLNTGAFSASGEFVTFLDDDDFWTDRDHLSKAHKALQHYPKADVYYANQLAVQPGQSREQGEVLWLGDMQQICENAGLEPSANAYPVTVDLLMQSHGFAHLNCSIVRRELFLALKGMDEDIRWQCDQDFYLRTLDAAGQILFNPDVVSEHHVPDKNKRVNLTTAISVYQRLNYQLYVYNKAVTQLKHRAIVRQSRRHRAYTIQKIAEALYQQGRYADAADFCREALFMTFSPRWPLFCLKVWFASAFKGP